MAKKIKLGLLGCGTVGTGVLKVLQENYHDIRAKIGNDIEVSKVLVRNLNKKRDFNGDVVFTDNIDDILNDESIDIVVELLGGIHPAREYMLKAMENGKHVVTANKDVLAQFGKDMFEIILPFLGIHVWKIRIRNNSVYISYIPLTVL